MKMRSSKLASTPPSGWCRQATPPQAPGAGCILLLPSSCAVAAGILPGGSAASNATKSGTSGWGPGGKMPPSTAGRMPAATGWRCARAGQGCIKLLRSMRQGWVPISLSETNPAGLAAGSRWSARAKGADHRVNADKTSCTQKGCQNGCQPAFDLTRTGADSTRKRAVLASLQDARMSNPLVRGSFPLLPRNDPRLPATNPAGLDWSAETNGKTSRKPAPACTNPSLMQLCGRAICPLLSSIYRTQPD